MAAIRMCHWPDSVAKNVPRLAALALFLRISGSFPVAGDDSKSPAPSRQVLVTAADRASSDAPTERIAVSWPAPKPPPEDAPGFAIADVARGTRLSWEGEAALGYIVWWSAGLDPPAWKEIGRVFARSRGALSFFDPERGDRRGFYRIEEGTPMALIPGSDGGGVQHGFYVGRYEVTVAEFARFLSDPATDWQRWYSYSGEQKIAQLRPQGQRWTFVPLTGWEDHPIQHISWQAAAAFCNWLSDKEALQRVYDEAAEWAPDVSKNGYRLPTSKEWYKAACWDPTKGNTGGFWKFACRSDELRPSLANYASGDPYETRDPERRTTPVGFYNGSSYRLYFRILVYEAAFTTEDARNYYGCYDTEGNVSEFVMIEADGGFEPGGMGSCWNWSYPSNWVSSPISEPRPGDNPTFQSSVGGFRLARTAP